MDIAIYMKRFWTYTAAFLLLTASKASHSKQIDVEGKIDVSDLVCQSSALAAKPLYTSNQEVTEPPSLDDLPETFRTKEGLQQKTIPLDIKKQGEILTIGIWGDSHSAANFFSDELISAIGVSKAQYRPTFIPPTLGKGGIRLPVRKFCKSNGWSYSIAYSSKGGNSLPYSPALANISNNQPDASLSIDFRFPDNRPALKNLTILIKPNSEDAVINLSVDSNAYENIVIPAGDDKITLKSKTNFSIVSITAILGTITIEGFLPVYDSESNLHLDTFGIPGATVRGWKVIDPNYMKDRLQGINYDLVILEYGTNEGADKNFDSVTYKEMLDAGLKKFKAVFPNAQCILIGPTDRGMLVKRQTKKQLPKVKQSKIGLANQAKSIKYVELLKYSQVHQKISDIQSKSADEYGCKFWSWQTTMGGIGGAYKWYYRSPRLMGKDLIHLTIPGYQESARSFIESINLKNVINNK